MCLALPWNKWLRHSYRCTFVYSSGSCVSSLFHTPAVWSLLEQTCPLTAGNIKQGRNTKLRAWCWAQTEVRWVAWADTHQGGMWSWVEATYCCSASWCKKILHTVWPQGTDGFAQLLPRTLPTRKHYHKVQMVWLQCHPLHFAQLRLVNKAQNALWFCTCLEIVRIWYKIVGTDWCVCPPHPSQKGCLMARRASLAILNVFTQEIRLVVAVLLLVLSVVVLQYLSLSIQNHYFVVFNNPCCSWTCLVWMWQNL